MSFVSNSKNFTINAGVCNNVEGNIYNYTFAGDRERDTLEDRRYEPDGIELIPRQDIKLLREIGSGPGYFLHSGTKRGRRVIMKVFDAHPNAREQLDSTLAMSRMLMHSNVLRVEGFSFPSSMHHFIAYENVHCKNADGPLADALKDDGDRSLRLAFTMVAGFAAGLNYLDVQGLAVANMGVQNFDVLLDINDRFILSVNPEWTPTDLVSDEHSANGTAWNVFNALCAKVLRSANHVIHAQEIERDPVPFERLPAIPGQKLPLRAAAQCGDAPDADPSDIPSIIARREYVWRSIDHETNSLSDVAGRMALDLGFELSSVNRFTWTDTKSPHRCPGYVREEITVAMFKAASAIVSRDAPSPLEICPICQEVVSHDEEFACVCGDPSPGVRPTMRCIVCKKWSHANCVGSPKELTCQACMESVGSSNLPFPPPPDVDHNRTKLNNIGQRRGVVVEYSDTSGTITQAIWTSVVYLNRSAYGRGTGSTKGEARERAAIRALVVIARGD
ncbi:hypothetical protein C8F04DRAFT_1088267 [Mycena alexandri]|uniref:DRBM domain-containing protein n=1 Tax=Mycena alexandri TaxID=1745969 RepID=A0AAD6X6Q4_9AGAR|nr:hypothetical protein C8F04DRAFT_1088267 [Mycena alexandri]